MSVETDVQTFIRTTVASAASLTFVGGVRKQGSGVPATAVFIAEYGGGAPNQFMNARAVDTYRRANIQVKVRGAINGYVATKTLANDIWNALDHPSNVTMTFCSGGSRNYTFIRPMQSGPVYIGQNDTEQDMFSINLNIQYGGGDRPAPTPPTYDATNSYDGV